MLHALLCACAVCVLSVRGVCLCVWCGGGSGGDGVCVCVFQCSSLFLRHRNFEVFNKPQKRFNLYGHGIGMKNILHLVARYKNNLFVALIYQAAKPKSL